MFIASRAFSSGDMGASHCRAQALGHLGSMVTAPRLWHTGSAGAARGLSSSETCRIFLDQGSNPCFLHWQAGSATREALCFLKCFLWLPSTYTTKFRLLNAVSKAPVKQTQPGSLISPCPWTCECLYQTC